jgi:hypothetical protein
MSRIDNATLLLNLTGAVACELSVFAVNYNVLRVMAGIKIVVCSTHLCLTVSCIISSANTYYEKQCKLAVKYNWLVKRYNFLQHFQIAGEFLIAFTTTFIWKLLKESRLTADDYSNNVKDWIIRSQEPYQIYNLRAKVQRLNENGEHISLRYSPTRLEKDKQIPGVDWRIVTERILHSMYIYMVDLMIQKKLKKCSILINIILKWLKEIN